MKKKKSFFYIAVSLLTLAAISIGSTTFAASDISSLPVNLGAAGITNMLYIVAFVGGALMILTPCSAATIPAYFANSFGDIDSGGSKWKITQRTIIFFLGFATVYSFMGGGASFIGRWLNIYQEQLSIITGILLIVFAVLIFSGKSFFSFSLTNKVKTKKTTKGTFAFGSLFAIGFSGCAGPILAAILTIASQLPVWQAVLLMFFYSLGMAVPLVGLSLIFDRYNVTRLSFFRWSKSFTIAGQKIELTLPNIISSVLLLAIGIVFIVFQTTGAISAKFPRVITDIGYSLQDTLLAYDIPGYFDVIAIIALIFGLIKFFPKIFQNINTEGWEITLSRQKIMRLLVIIVGGLFIISQIYFFTQRAEIKKQNALLEEKARPAEISLTFILDQECTDCFDISSTTELLQKQSVKVISQETIDLNSEEGKALVEKYAITKVPTFIASGELEKNTDVEALFQTGDGIQNGEFVLRNPRPPYRDVETGEVRGRFNITYLDDESCEECYDLNAHDDALANFGMTPTEKTELDISSEEGKALIEKYSIKVAPSILLTGDISVYPNFDTVWKDVGSIEEDGTYIFREGVSLLGTYKDLEMGTIVQPESLEKTAVNTDNGIHWHPTLSISIQGEEQEIPAGIGIGQEHEPMHTHENDGVIHTEYANIPSEEERRISVFFDIWGKEFSEECILDSCNGENGTVKMFVNGEENTEFNNYAVQDKDKIEIRFE